jgi:lipoate-protein ligase A
MDRDRLLLQQAESSTDLVTVVRLYRWSRPTVSVGRHQDLGQAIDLHYCKRNGIEWVRRPTGGRAVLHDEELTYAVVSNDPDLFPCGSISATYRLVSEILASGLGALGGAVALQRKRGSSAQKGAPLNPCFATASRHELLFQGRKLVGSAQRRLRHSFLQHGSIPIRLDYRRQAKVLRFDADRLRSSVTCWGEVSSSQNPVEDLTRALLLAFARYLRLLSVVPGLDSENSVTPEIEDDSKTG